LTATKLALKLSDYVITEAGFGADLGAEKFFDIKCRVGELNPSAVVMVVSNRAYKRHGAVNIQKHVETIKEFGMPLIIAINKGEEDPKEDILEIQETCQKLGVDCVVSEIWEKGGAGGKELADKVVKLCKNKARLKFIYDLKDPIEEKIEKIATKVYGADGVDYTEEAKADIESLNSWGLQNLPICVAKTQYSLTDNPKVYGRPKGFRIKVRELKASSGAGFIVAYTGAILTMPGLPKHPAAENMDITEDGKIIGLF